MNSAPDLITSLVCFSEKNFGKNFLKEFTADGLAQIRGELVYFNEFNQSISQYL